MRKRILGYLFFTSVLMIGCGSYDIESPSKVAGEYAFHFKTGEVEVVVMHEDMTYQQEFYRTLAAYQQRGQPLYVNSGTWSYKGNKIIWKNCFEFTEFRNPDHLKTVPEVFGLNSGAWLVPCDWIDARIDMNDDMDYKLVRVKNRSDVR